MDQTAPTASPILRAVFAVAGLAMLALWIVSLIPAFQNWNNPQENGFSFVPGFWGTITLLPFGVMTLTGAAIGHGRLVPPAKLALRLGCIMLVIVALLEGFRRFLIGLDTG